TLHLVPLSGCSLPRSCLKTVARWRAENRKKCARARYDCCDGNRLLRDLLQAFTTLAALPTPISSFSGLSHPSCGLLRVRWQSLACGFRPFLPCRPCRTSACRASCPALHWQRSLKHPGCNDGG